MSTTEGTGPTGEPKRARSGPKASTPVSVNPTATARLDAMTRERVDALEKDKKRLQTEVDRLRERVDQLGPENSRLGEALSNAESNNTLATILNTIGGFSVSYATFTGKAAETWSKGAAGCLLAGIGMLLWQSARRWRRQ
jgi:hypothetical protein